LSKGLYYSLQLQKHKNKYSKTDEVPVILYYYNNRKKLKLSTEVKVKIKDWGGTSTNPVLKSDPEYKTKNILLKSLLSQIEGIINKIIINGQTPETSLIKQNLKQVEYKKTTKTLKDVEYTELFKEYGKELMVFTLFY
jgi:hypothetical protein